MMLITLWLWNYDAFCTCWSLLPAPKMHITCLSHQQNTLASHLPNMYKDSRQYFNCFKPITLQSCFLTIFGVFLAAKFFWSLFTAVCIIKTISMLNVLFLFIHKPLCALPSTKKKKPGINIIIMTTTIQCQLYENPWFNN